MISFVNAKINLGLFVTNRRPDGYHDLETIFYPVGLYSGTHANPSPFCDILEVTPASEPAFYFTGRKVDCPMESNLVVKAAKLFYSELKERVSPAAIRLEKHLPDGAGMGGGSADASFTLMALNECLGKPFSTEELLSFALRLGADCPFFIINRPCFAQGVGERLEEVGCRLDGKWLGVVKPDIYISTKEAFSGISPKKREIDLKEVYQMPISEWKHFMFNDFENHIFELHPEMAALKASLYDRGAIFALMSGSGSSLYGIFESQESATDAISSLPAPYKAVLKL